MLRADLHAFPAGLALFLIYQGNAVYYMDGIKRAGLYTGAEPQTAAVAGLWPSPGHKAHHLAVLGSKIFVILSGLPAVPHTGHKGYFPL